MGRQSCSSSSPARRSPSPTDGDSRSGGKGGSSAMQFGWLTLAHSGSPEGDYGAIQELVEQACFAEAAGFDGIWLTEHNFTGESVYCVIPSVWPPSSRSSTTCRAVGSTSAWATGPT